jgi:hypothetical protein
MREGRLEEIRELYTHGVGDERWALEERYKLVAVVDPENVNSEIIYDLSGEGNSYWREKKPKADFIAACPEIVADLLAEVERLQGRLEAVCAIMTDPNAFYGEEVTVKVMEAVRGN